MADVKVKLKLANGNDLTVGTNYVTSIKSSVQSTQDASSLNYGVLANSGSIDIQDGKGYISDMIDDGTLPISNIDAKIEIDGTVFQQHITTDSDYDTENNQLSISLSNFVKDFDELKYKGYAYPDASRTVYQLFYDVLYSYYYTQYPSETYPDFIDNMFSSSALTYIKAITITYPVIEYGKTYREILDDLCTIAQLSMYTDNQNKPKFVSIRPVYENNEQINTINWKNIVDSLKYTKTVKNKYDGVNINKNVVSDLISYNSVLKKQNIVETEPSPISPPIYASELIDGNYNFAKSHVTQYAIAISFVKIKNYYKDGTFYVDYFSNNNLEKILNISNKVVDDDGVSRFSVNYKESKTTGCYANKTNYNTDTFSSPFYVYGDYEISYMSGNFNLSSSYTVTNPAGFSSTASVSVNDDSYLTVTRDDLNSRFIVNYHILAHQYIINIGDKLASTTSTDIQMEGTFYKYDAVSIDLYLYGNKRTITFEETSASTTNIENCKTKATVDSNKLLQNTTTYNNNEIAEVIKTNILNDYRVGISDATMSLNKNLYGVGDLVKYPEDNRVWRITGVNFNYDGGIKYPYELMQCKIKPSGYGLYDSNDRLIYDWYELIDDGKITVSGNTLVYVNGDLSGRFKINNTITSIGNSAFAGCSSLTNIDIPTSVTNIGNYAFATCRSLNNVVIPSSVNSIGYSTFVNCSSLSNITFNNELTTISEAMFDRCSSLTSFTIPNTVTLIEQNAFQDAAFESILIPNSVITIGIGAFSGSTKLKTVVIGTGLTTIKINAFLSDSLTSVTFNDSNNWYANNQLLNLTNPETNATYLKSTYHEYDWIKSS